MLSKHEQHSSAVLHDFGAMDNKVNTTIDALNSLQSSVNTIEK